MDVFLILESNISLLNNAFKYALRIMGVKKKETENKREKQLQKSQDPQRSVINMLRITLPDEYYTNILLSCEQKSPYFQCTYRVIVYLDLMTTVMSNTPHHSMNHKLDALETKRYTFHRE